MSKIEKIDDLLAIQRSHGKHNEYMLGMYNGLELARSVLTDEDPVYMDKDGTLDPVGIRMYPERFI